MSSVRMARSSLTRHHAAVAALLVFALAATATGDSRLVDAARNRDHRALRALLNQRADVNGRADDGATALLWAAHWNDLDAADLLIRAGADTNAANDLRITPLSLACTNGSAPLVERLVTAGANPNTPIATGETPIMTCAASGSADAVRTLIARGADVNVNEPVQNQTALMWAASQRHPAVVKALVEHGADLRARTRKGFTALHFAAREGDIESARLLLAAGLDVNIASQPETQPAPAGGRGEPGSGIAEEGRRGAGAPASRRRSLPEALHSSLPPSERKCRSPCSCWSREPIRMPWAPGSCRCIGRPERGKTGRRILCSASPTR